jgi:membrane protease YdiL (CAAX protease family)
MNDSMMDRHGARLRKAPLLVVVFLAVTFAVTWLAFLPLILRRTHMESTTGILLLVLGGGAPSITAFVLVALSAGREGVRGLWRGGTRWRVGVRWYAAVLLIPGLASGAAWAVAAAVGAEPPAFNPLLPALISGLLAGLLEEFGWSGLAFPTLQARYGVPPGRRRHGVHRSRLASALLLHPRDDTVQILVPGLPPDADPGKDHLRMDLQRVGRQHPVDGVVACLGECLVRDAGARARRRRGGRADGHAGLVGGGHRRAPQDAKACTWARLIDGSGARSGSDLTQTG